MVAHRLTGLCFLSYNLHKKHQNQTGTKEERGGEMEGDVDIIGADTGAVTISIEIHFIMCFEFDRVDFVLLNPKP